MIQITAALLTICALEAQAPTEPILDDSAVDLTKAPQIAPLPDGLPDPRIAPDQGWWDDKELPDQPWQGGTFLPAPLDHEVHRRLQALDRVPDAVQVQLDQLMAVELAKCDGRVAVVRARCRAETIRQDAKREVESWELSDVLIAGAVGLALGVAIGVFGGAMATR